MHGPRGAGSGAASRATVASGHALQLRTHTNLPDRTGYGPVARSQQSRLAKLRHTEPGVHETQDAQVRRRSSTPRNARNAQGTSANSASSAKSTSAKSAGNAKSTSANSASNAKSKSANSARNAKMTSAKSAKKAKSPSRNNLRGRVELNRPGFPGGPAEDPRAVRELARDGRSSTRILPYAAAVALAAPDGIPACLRVWALTRPLRSAPGS